jgi:type VI secretion system protein ImpA
MVERYWDTAHPQLDPEDDLDPTLRVNTLLALCDHESCLRGVLAAPLMSSAVLGPVSYRDYLVATGEIPPRADEQPRATSDIEGVFLNEDADELLRQAAALQAAWEDVRAIEDAVTAAVGAGRAVSFEPLATPLKKMHRLLQGFVEQRGIGAEPEVNDSDAAFGLDGGETTGEFDADFGGAADEPAFTPPPPDEIRSRDDVTRLLDKICDYYQEHEPSSPVPLLLKRAKRVATMSFLELLRELAPAGVEQAETLGGVTEN